MKFMHAFLITIVFALANQTYAQGDMLSVMTYNIKFDDTRDSVNNWERRKDRVIGLLNYHQPDIVGTQEGLHHQLEAIQAGMPDFKYIGVARDDGGRKGEYSAFFYDTTKLKALESGTFWLSKTSEKPSKDWDAALPRICSWARLEAIESGEQFFLFNTHFDHVGVQARLESIKLITQKIKEKSGQLPVILMGDFNFTPDADPYGVITEYMADAQKLSQSKPYGPEATFNGFNFGKMPSRRIDYIFLKGNITVKRFATLADSQNMSYPSDHFPVLARIQLN